MILWWSNDRGSREDSCKLLEGCTRRGQRYIASGALLEQVRIQIQNAKTRNATVKTSQLQRLYRKTGQPHISPKSYIRPSFPTERTGRRQVMPRASPCTAKSKQTCQEKLIMDKCSSPAIFGNFGEFLEIAGSKRADRERICTQATTVRTSRIAAFPALPLPAATCACMAGSWRNCTEQQTVDQEALAAKTSKPRRTPQSAFSSTPAIFSRKLAAVPRRGLRLVGWGVGPESAV